MSDDKQRLPDAVLYCEPMSLKQFEQIQAMWKAKYTGQLLILDARMRLEVVAAGLIHTLGDGIDALWRDT